MKLVRFSLNGEPARLGVTNGKAVASLESIVPSTSDMTFLIEHWEEYAEPLRSIDSFEYALNDVHLHAPIARPGKIFGIGLNYADHATEAGVELPKDQLWFSKAITAVNGPYDNIEVPLVSDALDYEAELVFVIGRRCRHVAPTEAMAAVFGYCIGNDVSVRDWQMKTSQFVLGKSFDTHAPFGPWVVTADALDPSDLEIASFVNGDRRQHSRTRHLIFGIAAQICHLSKAMTLEPGDVVFTGTPSGVGAAMKPPQWLHEGDVVRVEIEKIGFIENTVVRERIKDPRKECNG
jgi:ureidoglycolate lyase